jgi:hypothetical protein
VASEGELRLVVSTEPPQSVGFLGLSPDEHAQLLEAGPAAYPLALSVFTGDPALDKPAIAGSYALDADGLRFRPRFPFVSGVSYTARAVLGGTVLERRFEIAAPSGRPPRVLAVFPSGDALPENLLRFYVHFSQPMEAKDAHRHVHLRDDAGAEIALAFVEIEHGLWNPEQTRLTVLLHPGRIKRGVAPGERLGPPLRAGRSYRLVVDAAMADRTGRELGAMFERRFRVVGADRRSPSRGGLTLDAPARADEPVTLRLPEPLDEALLRRLVWVEDARGHALEGAVEVRDGESLWSFRPSTPWTPGRYAVRVHPALEDRAGNRFDRLFDREIDPSDEESSEVASSLEPLWLEFRIGF